MIIDCKANSNVFDQYWTKFARKKIGSVTKWYTSYDKNSTLSFEIITDIFIRNGQYWFREHNIYDSSRVTASRTPSSIGAMIKNNKNVSGIRMVTSI